MQTNCVYSNPQAFDGTPATASSTSFAFASSTCATVEIGTASTTVSAGLTEGDVVSSVLIFLAVCIAFYAYIDVSNNGIKLKK